MSEISSSNPAASEAASQPIGPRWWRILGWSCYLACSWTWCIGMFLPVLLLRDFGPWSFVVFAVPNVVGAAAMGWVLRRPGSAGRLREDHERVVRLFSNVTIGFQLFFASWLLGANATFYPAEITTTNPGGLSGGTLWIIAAVVGVVPPAILVFRSSQSPLTKWRAVVIWSLSFALFVFLGWEQHLAFPTSMVDVRRVELLPLGLVCAFGFLFCPYLDATFLHVSLNASSADAIASFVSGFCALFLLMILGTAGYAWMFDADGHAPRLLGNVPKIASILVFVHIAFQIYFTVIAHWEQFSDRERDHAYTSWYNILSYILLAFAAAISAFSLVKYAELSLGEIIYRLFMAFYGLIFPAYVWLCMIPNWLKGPPTRWQIRVWLGACLLASPMYWLGFIERETWWLGPGVGLVLLARVLIKARPHALAAAAIEPGPSTPPPPPAPPAGASPAI